MINHLSSKILAVTGEFPVYFVAVYIVGFIAAVVIGSIAWYSSKRPVGWEDAEKPDFIPEVKVGENKESEE